VVGPRGLESPYLRVCRRPILKVIPKTQNVRGSRVLFLKILQIVTLSISRALSSLKNDSLENDSNRSLAGG
jgi:hypothetical protein